MRRLILLLGFLPGCFMGTFHSPEVLAPNSANGAAFGVSGPAFLHPDHRTLFAQENLMDEVNMGGNFGFGLTRRLELGAQLSGLGVGPYAKVGIITPKRRRTKRAGDFSLSIIPSVLYDFTNYLINARADLVGGIRGGKSWLWYFGVMGVYAPAYGSVVDRDLWGEVAPGLYSGFYTGIDWSTKASATYVLGEGGKGKMDYGFRIEVGGSFFRANDSYYPVFTVGFGVTGGAALGCLKVLGGGTGLTVGEE